MEGTHVTTQSTPPSKGNLILRLRGVGKQFGAVTALEDIELDVHAGEVVALVGDNGAGKSTLVKVLAGVHQPTCGSIEYLGKPVSLDTPKKALEMGIATVFQDLALCENLDVVANLFLGHEINPWRMDEVQMEVRAWTLLQELAARIPSVREPIASLSGGQRQRIALARAILKDAPILVLDEATSALDSEVEASIQTALARVMEGKTVLAIAHRLSTLTEMDRIVVMDKGRIVEVGDHQTLLAKQGLYARYWDRQSGGFISTQVAQ